MKKIILWISIVTLIVFVIDLGIIGLKIFHHNYNVIPEAYVGLVCCLILPACGVFRLFTEKCPHCKKIQITKGKYCPYCGKEIGM